MHAVNVKTWPDAQRESEALVVVSKMQVSAVQPFSFLSLIWHATYMLCVW